MSRVTKNICILSFFLTLLTSICCAQESTEKEFVILTFEVDRNKDQHGVMIYYWITELEKHEKLEEYKEPIIYSIFLTEFYSRNQLEACCIGQTSYPFYVFKNDDYNFPDGYSKYLTDLREKVRKNRIKIQVINKTWKGNYKEKITVYGTPVKGNICECKYGGDLYLETGVQLAFPEGKFEVVEKY